MSELMTLQLSQQLPENRRAEFLMAYNARKKDPTTALLLSFFLGFWGVDRMYAGQVGLGVLKLFTLGGLFVWAFLDLFLIRGVVERQNNTAAHEIFTVLQSSSAARAA